MILAAGKGTRLGTLTTQTPKPLLPVGEEPVLVRIIRWLRGHQITEIAINLHHYADAVTEKLGEGQAYGVKLRYSIEETLLGTAGALKPLADFFDETFALVYGDVLTNLDLQAMLAFHRRRGAGLTLGLYRVDDPTRCGVVETNTEGRVQRFIEKPAPDEVFTDLANSGIYLIEPEILAHIPDGQFYDFGHDLFPKLLSQDIPLYGYPIGEAYLIDMGTPETYTQAQADYAAGKF